jgi:hypothetical protein
MSQTLMYNYRDIHIRIGKGVQVTERVLMVYVLVWALLCVKFGSIEQSFSNERPYGPP